VAALGGAAGGVLIVDPDSEDRAVAATVFERRGYETREATTAEEALELARRDPPRLVVSEVSLPGICGYELCHELRQEFGEGLPIILVSGERTEAFDRVGGLLIGADDYLVKPFAPDELLARARRLLRRTTPIAPPVAAKLTLRETEVLSLLAEGLEQDEIAARLFITRKTVGTHIEHVLKKLGVRSRAQAVALAYRSDLVESPVS
jgi:DNA-binding NarL/FixJ family response regulator